MHLDALRRRFLYCAMSSPVRPLPLSAPALAACLLGAAVLASALVSGCSSKEIRYPEDHARFKNIDRVVEELRTGYTRRDLSDIRNLMLPREVLEKAATDMQQDFQSYEEISLDWTIDRIVIEGETIDVVVNWAGIWRKTPADAGLRERGQGILKLTGDKTVMLNGLEGDLPFGMALRRPRDPAPVPLR